MSEFPKDCSVSARIHGSTKRKIEKLPYTISEILEIGAEYISNETNRLEFEKGELELEIAELDKQVSEKQANLQAINNRLRIIAPTKLSKDTLDDLIDKASLDYAKEIFEAHGENSLERLENKLAVQSVFSVAKEWHYDPLLFLEKVRCHLAKMCNTHM